MTADGYVHAADATQLDSCVASAVCIALKTYGSVSKRYVLDGLAYSLESFHGAAECHEEVTRVADLEEAVLDQTPHVAGVDLG